MQILVQASSLVASGFDPTSGHLADRNCTMVRQAYGWIWYEVVTQPEACGNLMKTNRTHVTFVNNIFIYTAYNSSFRAPGRIPISCTYPMEADSTLDVLIRPRLEEENGILGVGDQFETVMSLYRDATFNQPYRPGVVTIPVGSPLYVGVSVPDTGPYFAVVLEDCFASYSRNPHSPVKYPLIQNKCSADPRQVEVIENGRSTRARFSALFFPPGGQQRGMYLHCSLTLCDKRNYNCFTICRSRRNRSVVNPATVTPVSIGPINWAD